MKVKPSRREILAATAAMATGGISRAVQDAPARFPQDIRVGIIGLEGHYSEITKAAELFSQVRVTAVADRNESLRTRASGNGTLKNARSYDDYRRMLDAEKLDVVAVCGENGTRASIVQQCAERKLPIIAEKPLVITLEDLEAVKKKVSAGGAPLSMLLPMRCYPAYQAMRSIVQSGELGEVVSMGAQKSYKIDTRPAWMKLRKTFGGIIPYIGIHMVDLMRWVSAREFREASAFQSNVGFRDMGEMENNTAVIFRLDNQGTASLRMDYLRPRSAPTHGDDRLRIAGTQGIVEYGEGRALTLMTGAKKPTEISSLPPAKFLFVDFLDSLYNGKKHIITPEEVYRVTEIVLKAREAAESNRIVHL